jgi:hypothetical protein
MGRDALTHMGAIGTAWVIDIGLPTPSLMSSSRASWHR